MAEQQTSQGDMESALRQLFEFQQQQAGTMAALMARLEALDRPAPPLPPAPPAEPEPAPGRPPKAILPNPPRFTGKRVEYVAWKTEVQAKIRIDGAALGSPGNQFYYLYGRMEASAQLQISAHFNQMSADPQQATPEALLQYLDSIFIDPNAAARATDKLRDLRQRNLSFPAFLPQFERLIAEGNLSTAPDAVLINYLEGSISDELRRGMVYAPEEATYTGYVKTLLKLSSKLESLSFHSKSMQRSSTSQAPSTSTHRAPIRPSDPMDWEPTVRASRGKLTPAERQERLDKGLCLYCGAKGHRRAECPSAPLAQPSTRAFRTDPGPAQRAPTQRALTQRAPTQRAPAQRAPAQRAPARVQRAQPQAEEEDALYLEEEVYYDAEEDSENE
jgi:hypothetical protein